MKPCNTVNSLSRSQKSLETLKKKKARCDFLTSFLNEVNSNFISGCTISEKPFFLASFTQWLTLHLTADIKKHPNPAMVPSKSCQFHLCYRKVLWYPFLVSCSERKCHLHVGYIISDVCFHLRTNIMRLHLNQFS